MDNHKVVYELKPTLKGRNVVVIDDKRELVNYIQRFNCISRDFFEKRYGNNLEKADLDQETNQSCVDCFECRHCVDCENLIGKTGKKGVKIGNLKENLIIKFWK